MSLLMYDTGKELKVHALFVQPTPFCGMNCGGCYVKQHLQKAPTLPHTVWASLFRTIFHTKKLYANQVTLSLDTLPVDNAQRQWMQQIFQHFLAYGDLEINHTDIHLTTRSIETLSDYWDILKQYVSKCLPLDVLTLSSLRHRTDDLGKCARLRTWQPKLQINLNHQINPSHRNEIEYLRCIAPYIDSVYLLHSKRPIQYEEPDLERLIIDRKRISLELQRIQEIKDALQDTDVRVMTDGCLEDAKEFKHTGYGCPSSISRFQIWPDGSVSGCAYAKESATTSACSDPEQYAIQNIIDNIRLAKQRYDFNMCYIRKAYP